MSDALILGIVTAGLACISTVLVAYLAYLGRRTKRAVTDNTAVVVEARQRVEEIGAKTDGQLGELVAMVRTVARAEGRAEGVAATEALAAEEAQTASRSARDRAAGRAEGRAEPRVPDP